jgi:nucleoside-diphosphate-sugar epimerase
MRVLILGGTLFIGRRIALELLARGRRRDGRPPGRTEPAELSELSGRESELPSL